MPSIIPKMRKKSIYDTLNQKKPGVLALFDPDRMTIDQLGKMTKYVCDRGVAGILVGSSLLMSPHLDTFIAEVKKHTAKPVILFPGGSHQVSANADAIFFLSLLSGRNAEFLVGEQVKAVFLVKEYGLDVIPVGYILIESGHCTAVEYMSNTRPIPRLKPEIAMAHALTGEYFGMKYIYLEAGSGAQQPVPIDMVKKVKETISIPLIVGGGIRSAETAQGLIKAGADYIVLGSIIERSKEQFEVIMKGAG
ncbi:MAG: geranylgeranylglyceryl/heptaprenylglyceryl phosphate synthase [bacterium]